MLQGSSTLETRYQARELKFLVPLATAPKMLQWARGRLAPDPHAAGEFGDEYHTTSLYFDTRELDVYHRRGSFRRSKYRIRHYGGTAELFLERKLRTSSVVTKRRTIIAPDELTRLTAELPDPAWEGGWFLRRLSVRRLAPTCQVSYTRVARVGANDAGPIRLTCDHDIRAIDVDGVAFSATEGKPALEGQVVVELKFRDRVPAIFRHFIEEFALEPAAASKYRFSLEALGKVGHTEGDAPTRARADEVDIVDA